MEVAAPRELRASTFRESQQREPACHNVRRDPASQESLMDATRESGDYGILES